MESSPLTLAFFLFKNSNIGNPGIRILALFILFKILDHVPQGIEGHGNPDESLHLDPGPCLRPNQASRLNSAFGDPEINAHRV